jgi:hypothetical protein
MAEAIKCDLTGDLVEGAGVKVVDVDIAKGLRIRATLFVQKRPDQWVEGVLSPEAAKKIEASVATLRKGAK